MATLSTEVDVVATQGIEDEVVATYSLCCEQFTMYSSQIQSSEKLNFWTNFPYFSVFFALCPFVLYAKNSVSLQSEKSETNPLFCYFASIIFASVLLQSKMWGHPSWQWTFLLPAPIPTPTLKHVIFT